MGTYRGLKIAKATTNLYKLSRKSVTQTVTVVSGTVYTVSCRGKKGSLALSGAGTGAVTDGVPRTFTASSNSLVVTVTGYLKHIQVETGDIASQEVWTSNTAYTRNADDAAPITGLQAGGKLGATAGAIVIDLERAVCNTAAGAFLSLVKANSTATENSIRLLSNVKATGQLRVRIHLNSVITVDKVYTAFNLLSGGKIGLSWSFNELKVFYNGALIDTLAFQVPSGLDSLTYHSGNNEIIYRGVYLFNHRPADADMIASTQGGALPELPFPVSQGLTLRTPQTLTRPGYLQSVTDSAFPGVKITRVSNGPEFSLTGNYVVDTGYSKRQPWSRNGTYLRVGTRHLLNGNTYEYLDYMDTSYKLWSNATDNKMYCFYKAGNVKVYNPATQTMGANILNLSTLPGYDSTFDMSVGNYEGNISIDDTRVVLNIKQSGVIRNVVVNLLTGAIIANHSNITLGIDAAGADWVTVSPSGQYLVVSELDGTGSTLNKRTHNLITGAVIQADLGIHSHRDVGYDSSIKEILVGTLAPVAYDIISGVRTDLLLSADFVAAFGTTQAHSGHSSGRAFNLPGWMLFSMTNNTIPYKEIMFVKTDGSKQVMRLASARMSSYAPHTAVGPQAAPNLTGTKVLYASDWGAGSGGPCDAYVIDIA